MAIQEIHPTPYPAINAVMAELSSNVEALLKDQFTGLYLVGSLALGDFNPQTSDIDFVGVTAGELPAEMVSALASVHARLAAASLYGDELEGSYVPQTALRSYDPQNSMYPHIERGGGLSITHHDSDWVIQRYILREYGLVVIGPQPRPFIDPILPDDLRRAVRAFLDEWWAPMLQDPAHLEDRAYQNYAILTMCRLLYTLRNGAIASKPAAARWAQASLGSPWARIIKSATAGMQDTSPDKLNDVLSFIRFTLDNSNLEETSGNRYN
jgi:hypothetical protein